MVVSLTLGGLVFIVLAIVTVIGPGETYLRNGLTKAARVIWLLSVVALLVSIFLPIFTSEISLGWLSLVLTSFGWPVIIFAYIVLLVGDKRPLSNGSSLV